MGTLARRTFLQSVAALLAMGAAPGCARTARPVAIAAGIWQGYEPLFLASRQGWLDKSLIHLAELPSNASSVQALASGIVAGAALTLDEVLRARSAGLALGIVMVFDVSAGADMLLVQPGIAAIGNLKGKRIGVDQGTNAALLLAKALQSGGLRASDVIEVPMAIGDQIAAWERQLVDAVITYEPAASKLQAMGARRLFDSSKTPDSIVDVLAIRSDYLDQAHAEAIRHVIAAHFRALDFLRRQPDAAALQMARHLGLTRNQVLASYAGMVLPELSENRRLLTGKAPALLSSARMIAAFMLENGLLPRADELDNLIVGDYLPEES